MATIETNLGMARRRSGGTVWRVPALARHPASHPRPAFDRRCHLPGCAGLRVATCTALVAAFALLSGCAGPKPKLFPLAPAERRDSPGGIERLYDVNGDGRADYAETLPHGPDARVAVLRFDLNGDGDLETEVDWATAAAGPDVRHLIIILDSVPYAMVREHWEQGRFRLFDPPSRVISPFPVMTDPCLAEFFGVSPCPGVEALHHDGRGLRGGTGAYLRGGNSPWLAFVDYRLGPGAHAYAYLWPGLWYDHDLGRIQRGFERSQAPLYVGYAMSTSALGAQRGRNGHQVALVKLERLCRQIVYQTRGHVQITLLSDHGHDLVRSQRLALDQHLRRCGWNVTGELRRPEDVSVPQFGAVTCAALYTRWPEAVARDAVGFAGVDLAAYLDADDGVIVLNRNGRARIERAANGFRYVREFGDPLVLAPILDELRRAGQLTDDGSVADDVLFAATTEHVYPDPLHRLWRAFHGLFVHTPDVLLSIHEGWHVADAFFSDVLGPASSHGALSAASSTAFVMTTAGELPAVLRMEDLAAELRELGVPLGAVTMDK